MIMVNIQFCFFAAYSTFMPLLRAHGGYIN